MKIISDNIEFAEKIGYKNYDWQGIQLSKETNIAKIINGLITNNRIYLSKVDNDNWNYLITVKEAEGSQFDVLTKMMKSDTMPDRLLAMAGTGKKFHGFRNRPWSSHYGNLHLSIFLAPNRKIDNFLTVFTILSAVSVVETIDLVKGLNKKSGIKWINDIFMDGRKVSGFLVNTQAQGDKITGATLGIGLNVEVTPEVDSTAFVPLAASLRDFTNEPEKIILADVFNILKDRINENYEKILMGKSGELIEKYSERSIIIGRKVRLATDPRQGNPATIAEGIAEKFGDNLELYISGSSKPFNSGRLILLED